MDPNSATMRSPIDAAIDALLARDMVPEEDVSWIALTREQISCLPGEHFVCPIRGVECVLYRGIEFRFSPWARPSHRVYPVWDITKRTKPLFNKSEKDEG